jgi:hypothetical protein
MQSAQAAADAMQSAARGLRELARVPSYASPAAARSIAVLIDQEFQTGRDPYGKPWKANAPSTVRRKGHANPNIDTLRLRHGITVKPMSGAGVSVTIHADYAAFVQKVRPILPNNRLPRAWAAAIAGAITDAKRHWADRSGAKIDSVDAMIELAALLNDQAAE